MRRGRPHVVGGLKSRESRSRIKLGVAGAPNLTRFSNAVAADGGAITWVRSYPQPATTLTGAQLTTGISAYTSAGLKVYVSFKSAFSWTQVASGSDDARWTDLGNALGALSPGGAWTFNHEPENDPPNGSKGSTTYGNQFTAAFDHVASIIKPLAPNWLVSPNLFDEVFPEWANVWGSRGANWQTVTDPEDWIPTSTELLGVDFYAYRGASDAGNHWAQNDSFGSQSTQIAEFITYAQAHGVQLCFPEFGSALRDPALDASDESRRQTWFNSLAASWAGDPRILFVAYFELNDVDNSGVVNWSITDATKPPTNATTVADFVAIGA